MGNVELEAVSQRILPEVRNEVNRTLSFRCVHSGRQSTTEHLPVRDAEKITDALRAGPNFITDGATIVDYPASKGGEFRVLRKGSSEWTCLPGPPPGSKHNDPGCFDGAFFQWVKHGLAGRPQQIDRLGVAYMYMGQWVPGASGGEFHGGHTLWW